MEKILVLGLSKSGISAAKLAKNLEYDVYLTEGKNEVNELQVKELQKRMAQLEEENLILKKAIAIFTPHSAND